MITRVAEAGFNGRSYSELSGGNRTDETMRRPRRRPQSLRVHGALTCGMG